MRVVEFRSRSGEEWTNFDVPPGRHIAERIRKGLAERGSVCDDIELHSEYGWAWVMKSEDVEFYVLLFQTEGVANQWLIRVNERASWLRFWQPRGSREDELAVCKRVHAVLDGCDDISDVRWYDGETYFSGARSDWSSSPG